MTAALNKILLVDDDSITNMMHQRQIARRGLAARVDVATDGVAALDYLRGCDPDRDAPEAERLPELILLDINMPRMNGFEFLEAYGDLPPQTHASQRIVMVSTSTLRRDRSRAEQCPFVSAFETKPLSDGDLERIVRGCQPETSAPVS